jgi:molybdate-binding protein/DNA-binding transcriptional regulator YhcF (GntR family)
LHQQIAESLRLRIASGDLAPGDHLPPVRETAEAWGCSPGTAGRAYSQLTREGLVEGFAGGGTRVRPGPLHSREAGLGWASLVNRAEGFLLEAIGEGYSPPQVEAALATAVARWNDLPRQTAPASPSRDAGGLRFAGSHDLAFEVLGGMLPPGTLDSIDFVGSLGGLIALARGDADLAGTHLWDAATDTYNLPFVSRLLPGRRAAVLTLAHRSLGLITPPGNPQGLRGPADLAQPGVRFVNRQAGSGTRVWFDAQLCRSGVDPAAVAGYEREAPTHLGVARAIHEGEATAGLGIAAAANAYGLGFLPLVTERYDLVLPEEAWVTPSAQALAQAVRSPAFAAAVADLGGYDTTQTGHEEWVGA